LGLSLDVISGNSVWLVAKFSGSGTIFSNGSSIGDSSPYSLLQLSGTNLVSHARNGTSANIPIVYGTRYLVEIHRSPSTERMFINGVLKYSRAVWTTGNRNNFYVNNGYFGSASWDMADMTIFNTAISPSDELAFRNQQMTKWNIV